MTRYLTTLLAVVAFLLGMTIEETYGQLSPQDISTGSGFYSQEFNWGNSLPTGWGLKTHSSSYRTINGSPGGSTQWDFNYHDVITSYPWSPGSNEYLFRMRGSSDTTKHYVAVRRRSSVYSGNLVVALRNNLAIPITQLDVQYYIAKFGVGTNVNGTRIDLWYTTNSSAAEVDVDAYEANSSANSNPSIGWVKAEYSGSGVPDTGSTYRSYYMDNTNTNPSNVYPFLEDYVTPPTWNSNTFGWPNGTNTVGASLNFTSSPVSINSVIYVNILFSFVKPVSQQGNNAFDSQTFGLDYFRVSDALPVELISFSALYRNKSIELKWKTATEVDNYGFEIERSYNQKEWSKIDFVAGQGTVNTPTDYTYTDKSFDLSAPVVSYRLRQLDRDGSYDYSEVVTVAIESSPTISLRNFPNPFNPSTTISFNLKTNDVVTLTVYNELGQAMERVLNNEALNAGSHAISFNGDNLPSGTYMYELRTSAGTTINKMILSK